MENIIAFIAPFKDNVNISNPLFYSATDWIVDSLKVANVPVKVFTEALLSDDGLHFSCQVQNEIQCLPKDLKIVLFLQNTPCISTQSIIEISAQNNITVRSSSNGEIAIICTTIGNLADAKNINDICKNFKDFEVENAQELLALSTQTYPIITSMLRNRVNSSLLEKGVAIMDTASVYVSPEAQIESGVIILPNCIIRGQSIVKSGAVIGPNALLNTVSVGNNTTINNSQVYESSIGNDTTIGPFAYIRPECNVGNHVRVGDFVELKKTTIGNSTKISHLTYIGDANVGERVNFGCGCVTANYDGKLKQQTIIGDDAFLGCNTNLIAPVKVGRNAYTAAGSTIVHDVPENALVIARSPETIKENWAIEHETK